MRVQFEYFARARIQPSATCFAVEEDEVLHSFPSNEIRTSDSSFVISASVHEPPLFLYDSPLAVPVQE